MRLPLISALLLVTALLIIPLTTISAETTTVRAVSAATPATPAPSTKAAFNTVWATAPLASTIATTTATSITPTPTANLPTLVNVEPHTTTPAVETNPVVKITSPSRVEERLFNSSTFGRTMHYYVYLPAGYDDDPRSSIRPSISCTGSAGMPTNGSAMGCAKRPIN